MIWIFVDIVCVNMVEVGFEMVIRLCYCRFIRLVIFFDSMKRRRMRFIQYVIDVDYNRIGFCGDWSEFVINGMVVMVFLFRVDFEIVFFVMLEQES